MKQMMKQQCPMAFIYLSWAIFIGGLFFFAVKGGFASLLLWLVIAPLAEWAYIRAFPAISQYIGYGSVEDRHAEIVASAPARVTMYAALGCPFCPVVKRRLLALQAEMGFDLDEVDVTLKPDLLITKGVRAVPVVEVGEKRLVGHATSEQLAALIRNSQSSSAVSASPTRA